MADDPMTRFVRNTFTALLVVLLGALIVSAWKNAYDEYRCSKDVSFCPVDTGAPHSGNKNNEQNKVVAIDASLSISTLK